MPRQPHHSGNWGGPRANSGRPQGSVNRLAQKAVEMAEAAETHPLEFLLGLISDKKQPMKLRADAAQACLPYIAPRLSAAEISVQGALENLSNEEIHARLLAVSEQLQNLPRLRLINGSAERQDIEFEAEPEPVAAAAEFDS